MGKQKDIGRVISDLTQKQAGKWSPEMVEIMANAALLHFVEREGGLVEIDCDELFRKAEANQGGLLMAMTDDDKTLYVGLASKIPPPKHKKH